MPTFEELPFNSRPDLSPYLLHMTKNTEADDEYSAFENLVNILKEGQIWGSGSQKGFIKGSKKASCFMDVPFASLKYVLTPENSDPEQPRYEAYGIAITKQFAYKGGCRPVMYLSDEEIKILKIANDQLWRVVKLEVSNKKWISWLHEREWRCLGNFSLPKESIAVLVKSSKEAMKLQEIIRREKSKFKCIPRSIIPLNVICQGLLT